MSAKSGFVVDGAVADDSGEAIGVVALDEAGEVVVVVVAASVLLCVAFFLVDDEAAFVNGAATAAAATSFCFSIINIDVVSSLLKGNSGISVRPFTTSLER